MINVSQLKKGIVIDHIEAGRGFDIFRELHLNELDDPVVLLCNVPSSKIGKKDMIKIETDYDIDMTVLGLIDPNVSVNIIRDGKVISRIKLTLPVKVKGILKCKNPRCITHSENVGLINFHLVDGDKRIYRCEYCDGYTQFREN